MVKQPNEKMGRAVSSSEAWHLMSMRKALGSIHSTIKKKNGSKWRKLSMCRDRRNMGILCISHSILLLI
jgi:hypothetical protein